MDIQRPLWGFLVYANKELKSVNPFLYQIFPEFFPDLVHCPFHLLLFFNGFRIITEQIELYRFISIRQLSGANSQ
mgnify:CR=1 FL=1